MKNITTKFLTKILWNYTNNVIYSWQTINIKKNYNTKNELTWWWDMVHATLTVRAEEALMMVVAA